MANNTMFGANARLFTDASGNTVLVGGDGENVRSLYDPTTPVLLIGGDHPYQQWYGTNGSNGMAGMYSDKGFRPYLAINTGPLNSAIEDPVDYMGYDKISTISGKVDVIAHGHRHPQDWRLVNTGMVVRYTGAAASGTVAISASAVTGATTGAVDDFSLDITTAPYDTLAEVVAAIDALPNWTCTLSGELLGTESALNLLVRAAADAKTANLYLCAGAGILLTNTGTTYRRLSVGFSGGALSIFADGVTVYSASISALTLTQVVTAVNALGGGITAELTSDNERNSNNYCSGSELGASITSAWSGRKNVGIDGLYIHGGLGHWYIVDRQFKKCVDVAAANGLQLRDFAQSGGGFHLQDTDGHVSFRLHRGNKKGGATIAPNAFMRGSNFIHHNAASQAYYPTPSYARLNAVLEALVDSPGYCVNLLMHQLLADGSSGYNFPTSHPANYDQVETDWMLFLASAKAAVDAGSLVVLGQEEYYRSIPANQARNGNLLFNPRLKNSNESLLVAASDGGKIVPGWRVGTVAANCSSSAIDADGFLSVSVTSGSLALLQQTVDLPPGLYEFRAQVPALTYSSGEGFVLGVTSYSPDYFGLLADNPIPGQTLFFSPGALRGPGELSIKFSISPPKPAPAQAISKNSQTWNLSTNKNIRVNVNNIGLTADIDCSAGATSAAAVTAKEVAAAINAGMAASASYGAEYHTIAKAANGKVIITSPYIGSDRTHNITISDGTSVSATFAIFGGSVEALPMLADNSMFGGVPITLTVNANCVGSVKIGAFSLRRIGGQA